MRSLTELLAIAGVTSHKLTILTIRKNTTNWGIRGRSVRSAPRYTVWYDTEDQNDRIVLTFETILNTKKTAPEKRVDLNIQISHYSDWDPVTRRLTVSHPERYLKVDGMAEGGSDNTKALWKEVTALVSSLQLDPKLSCYDEYYVP